MFTRPDVIQRLKSEFIPFAGNTNELQVSKWESPERSWFLSTAEKVHPGVTKGVTGQGFYVVGADGQAYKFSMHGRQRDEFMKLLDEGLEAFKNSPPEAKHEPLTSPRSWSRERPAGTTVVRSISRILPLPEDAPEKNRSIGRDHFWIFPEDIQAIQSNPLTTFPLPAKLARRLARFHLVDNVRGEPNRWRFDNIRTLDIQVTRVSKDEYQFHGLFRMTNLEGRDGTEKGIAGMIEGTISLNSKGELMSRPGVSFIAYAQGYAWGDHANTNGAPEGKYPIKMAFQTVDDEIALSVPPQQSYFWTEYLNPLTSKRDSWP
ncbi:hypothetical protein CCB80_06015 [Armatimonadetes bacterium Uphvl-Ar1]|nr:hypothetical protein CCB80_06015 [Armatimonadetes bacterium Uphvl-Ar1]